MQLKLNEKKTYGVVYGMPGVSYQQENQFFDNEGRHVGPVEVTTQSVEISAEQQEAEEVVSEFDDEYYKVFLKQVLEGGPISKTAIFKEIEDRKLNWDRMRSIAAQINVNRFNRKSQEYWELNKE